MLRFLQLLSMLAIAGSALGDGIYEKLGSLVNPTIPYQRALIACRNGEETMIVESELNGPPGDYAWIVPIPNPPTKILEVDPRALDRITRHYTPQVVPVAPGAGTFWMSILLLGGGIAALWKPSRGSSIFLLLAGFLGYVLSGIFAPVYAGSSAARGGVETIKSLTVGSYKIEVVRSKDALALSRWLRQHGGQLPKVAEPIVDQYVKEGWCFMVSKLDATSGSGSPHPLAVTFKSKEAVYPMRLTAAQGNQVVVDLLVVASGTVSAPPLRIWRTQNLEYDPTTLGHNQKENDEFFAIDPLACLTWPDSSLTRLRGEMSPAEMKKDIVFTAGPYHPETITVAERDGYPAWVAMSVFVAISVTVFLCGLISGFLPPRGRFALVGTLICVALVGGLTEHLLTAGVHPIESGLVSIP